MTENPLEAMRMGCKATTVTWFILKCTLEYPQKRMLRFWTMLPSHAMESMRSDERWT